MLVDQEYFAPFDALYALVTAKVRPMAAELSHEPERRWLETLMVEFHAERGT